MKFKKISNIFIAGFVLSILFFTANLIAWEKEYPASGPFQVKNNMPMYIFYMTPIPQKAQTLQKGNFLYQLSYHVSNIILQQRPSSPTQTFGPVDAQDREWWVYIDTEVNRVNLNIYYGITDRLQFSVDVPYYFFSKGYLDGFIEGFEDSFSAIKTPNAREERERYTYEYNVRNKANPITFSTSEPNDFGEISGNLKYLLFNESDYMPATSIRFSLKIPNSSDNLLGSGYYDYGIGFLFDKRLFEKLFLYFNADLVFIKKPDIYDPVEVLRHKWHAMLAAEYCFSSKNSILFQATANTRIYDQGIPATDYDAIFLTLGYNHNFNDRFSWQVGIDENINSPTPDFGIYTSFKVKI